MERSWAVCLLLNEMKKKGKERKQARASHKRAILLPSNQIHINQLINGLWASLGLLWFDGIKLIDSKEKREDKRELNGSLVFLLALQQRKSLKAKRMDWNWFSEINGKEFLCGRWALALITPNNLSFRWAAPFDCCWFIRFWGGLVFSLRSIMAASRP